MKEFFYFILIIKIFKIIITIVPVWNFNNSVIDLFSEQNSYEYTIAQRSYGGDNPTNIILKKQISKNNGVVKETNILKIENVYEGETDWEDIESIYTFKNGDNNIVYICPKGKNHLNKFIGKDEGFEEIKPKEFEYDGEIGN